MHIMDFGLFNFNRYAAAMGMLKMGKAEHVWKQVLDGKSLPFNFAVNLKVALNTFKY